jgi:putative transposase
MARLPRIKVDSGPGWYHLCSRVAGSPNWFPFDEPAARQKLYDILRFYLRVYFCDTAGFCIMSNHYHLLVRFLAFRKLDDSELLQRAKLLYRRPQAKLRTKRQRKRFNERLFDVSELMRNVQMAYAKWYNLNHNRRGAFWAERFKSVLLQDQQAVLNALLYVELNPLRAGLVSHPELWRFGSAHLRALGQDDWLIPLHELIEPVPGLQPLQAFRALLHHRGAVQGEPGEAVIPPQILLQEQRRGFAAGGLFRQRLRCFSDALAVGSQQQVQHWVDRLRRSGLYLRRKRPIQLHIGEAEMFLLREQRKLHNPANAPGTSFPPPV